MKRIHLILLAAFAVVTAYAATYSRVSVPTFKPGQARVLNSVIGEIETSVTAAEESITTASLTNGATLTATSDVYVITGIGGANDTTNTITLANATNGQRLTLIVSATSTNLITIADSGNAALSGAWVGDNNDVIELIGVSTTWVQTGEENN